MLHSKGSRTSSQRFEERSCFMGKTHGDPGLIHASAKHNTKRMRAQYGTTTRRFLDDAIFKTETENSRV